MQRINFGLGDLRNICDDIARWYVTHNQRTLVAALGLSQWHTSSVRLFSSEFGYLFLHHIFYVVLHTTFELRLPLPMLYLPIPTLSSLRLEVSYVSYVLRLTSRDREKSEGQPIGAIARS